MNTTVIDRARGVGKVRKSSVRSASRRGSLVRRFRNFIELSDWDEDLLPAQPRDRCLLLDAGRRRGGADGASRFLVMKG